MYFTSPITLFCQDWQWNTVYFIVTMIYWQWNTVSHMYIYSCVREHRESAQISRSRMFSRQLLCWTAAEYILKQQARGPAALFALAPGQYPLLSTRKSTEFIDFNFCMNDLRQCTVLVLIRINLNKLCIGTF